MDTQMDHNCNPSFHDSDGEEDETLSLCDLPIYGRSQEDRSFSASSSSSDGQIDHNFEFFSQEWSTAVSYPADNILFCGKLIPHKENAVSANTLKLKTNKQRKRRKHGVLKWSLKSKTQKSNGQKGKFMKEKPSSLPYSSSFNSVPSPSSRKCSLGNRDVKNGVLEQRITILKSPTKSRWFLFMFGMARVPTEVELREERKRQNMKSKSLRSYNNGGGNKNGMSKGKGWWKVIRALGCSGSHHTDAVMKASYGCAPLVRE